MEIARITGRLRSHCACGQLAIWIVRLPTGVTGKPQQFRLCDNCLAIEQQAQQDTPIEDTHAH